MARNNLPTDVVQSDQPRVPYLENFQGSSRPHILDATDKQILELLALDGRAPFLAIASKLGLDEKTIRYRVAKMKGAGVLTFQALINPNVIEKCVVFTLGVKLLAERKKDAQAVGELLGRLPQVVSCVTVMGSFDLFVTVALERFEQMRDFQQCGLLGIDGIESIETFLAVSYHGRIGIPYFLNES